MALANSLENIKNIKTVLEQTLKINRCVLYNCQEVIDAILKTISDNPTQSEFIKFGVNNNTNSSQVKSQVEEEDILAKFDF